MTHIFSGVSNRPVPSKFEVQVEASIAGKEKSLKVYLLGPLRDPGRSWSPKQRGGPDPSLRQF